MLRSARHSEASDVSGVNVSKIERGIVRDRHERASGSGSGLWLHLMNRFSLCMLLPSVDLRRSEWALLDVLCKLCL